MRSRCRQIKGFDRAVGLEFEDLRDLGGQYDLVDGCGIEGDRLFEFYLEGVVKLAVVPELPGEMKALGILERLA